MTNGRQTTAQRNIPETQRWWMDKVLGAATEVAPDLRAKAQQDSAATNNTKPLQPPPPPAVMPEWDKMIDLVKSGKASPEEKLELLEHVPYSRIADFREYWKKQFPQGPALDAAMIEGVDDKIQNRMALRLGEFNAEKIAKALLSLEDVRESVEKLKEGEFQHGWWSTLSPFNNAAASSRWRDFGGAIDAPVVIQEMTSISNGLTYAQRREVHRAFAKAEQTNYRDPKDNNKTKAVSLDAVLDSFRDVAGSHLFANFVLDGPFINDVGQQRPEAERYGKFVADRLVAGRGMLGDDEAGWISGLAQLVPALSNFDWNGETARKAWLARIDATSSALRDLNESAVYDFVTEEFSLTDGQDYDRIKAAKAFTMIGRFPPAVAAGALQHKMNLLAASSALDSDEAVNLIELANLNNRIAAYKGDRLLEAGGSGKEVKQGEYIRAMVESVGELKPISGTKEYSGAGIQKVCAILKESVTEEEDLARLKQLLKTPYWDIFDRELRRNHLR